MREEGGADYHGFLRVPGHCGYCLPESPSSQLLPRSSQVTPHCEYAYGLPARGGGGSRSQAKGTSLVLPVCSLRKGGYCSAYIGVNLKRSQRWGSKRHEGGLRRQGVQEAIRDLRLSLSHCWQTPPNVKESSCVVVQACNPNAWAVQAGKSGSSRSSPAT